jgi:hypothetical protein
MTLTFSISHGLQQTSQAAANRPVMTPIFAMDGRGTVRITICVGPLAFKIARNAGRRCNRFEADLWSRTTAARRNMLCPELARLPFDVALVMPRARPLDDDEHEAVFSTGSQLGPHKAGTPALGPIARLGVRELCGAA